MLPARSLGPCVGRPIRHDLGALAARVEVVRRAAPVLGVMTAPPLLHAGAAVAGAMNGHSGTSENAALGNVFFGLQVPRAL